MDGHSIVTLNPILNHFTMVRFQDSTSGLQDAQKRGQHVGRQSEARSRGVVQQADQVMAGGDGNDWFDTDGGLVWSDVLQN